MGVNGLWTVVQPCARPTNLATLNRKRLAVDASIWIYQFLKAVRDKEGNALRNSHVVGFFRRICKLLWFGIQPVFVFDGGAPALKRATIQGRKRRREGRREDAVRTAGKLLAVQMQRAAVEEQERRRREQDRDISAREEAAQAEEIPDANNMVYVDEIGMSQRERQQSRRFHKQDAYHLPELDGGIAAMGKPEDPRIMSVEELEQYARQFHSGEDVNLYDFSKIDFNGDFFKSLPPPDRYNILNAARLRSRLRMGLSKDQLDDMFPDRMAFSKFQIERVKERNHLTQRLMAEVGMTGTDLTIGVNGRIAGERDREYILVKNDGVEGGWALGVVSKEKDIGEAHKPIDVDAIDIQYQSKDQLLEEEEDDFEDIPIEGLNRLPKPSSSNLASLQAARGNSGQRQQAHAETSQDAFEPNRADDEGSLFVGGPLLTNEASQGQDEMHPEERDDISRAIEMSMRSQHGVNQESEEDQDDDFEDVPAPAPEWTQRSVDPARPIGGSAGLAIARIVNNRASAAVPKHEEKPAPAPAESDSEEDMQAVMAKSRQKKRAQPKPVLENKKNPFEGPLPFPKLDWGSSLFAKKEKTQPPLQEHMREAKDREIVENGGDEDGVMEGGFEREDQADDGPKPLPPWLADSTDIRESLQKQKEVERGINAEDRMEVEEEERLRRRDMRDRLIEVESSSDGGSDVEILDKAPSPKLVVKDTVTIPDDEAELEVDGSEEVIQTDPTPEPAEAVGEQQPQLSETTNVEDARAQEAEADVPQREASPETELKNATQPRESEKSVDMSAEDRADSASPEPELEDVNVQDVSQQVADGPSEPAAEQPTIQIHVGNSVDMSNEIEMQEEDPRPSNAINDDDLFADVEYDEFSDPEEEELMAQMAEEAEEHARFASELNQKSAEQNREEYEKELRTLRSQQKKDRRDADEVTQVMVTECQALLRLFGIPYITAPMEAEAQCAELVKLGLVDGIVTDDSDTFLFGGTRVYKNMFNSNKFVECYLGGDLEKELSLSREQLISLAQLLGSDYTEGLPGVGPVTAVEILSEFPGKLGLEHFREWWKAVQAQTRSKEEDAPSPFRKKFCKSQATKLFLPPGFPNPAVYEAYLHPDVDASSEDFQWGVPDLEGLRRFLMATIGWSKERTDEVLVPVIKDMNKRDREGTQSNITRFFGGGVGVGAKEAFAPRQRAAGSKRMAAAVDKLRANTAGDERNRRDASGQSKRRRTEQA